MFINGFTSLIEELDGELRSLNNKSWHGVQTRESKEKNIFGDHFQRVHFWWLWALLSSQCSLSFFAHPSLFCGHERKLHFWYFFHARIRLRYQFRHYITASSLTCDWRPKVWHQVAPSKWWKLLSFLTLFFSSTYLDIIVCIEQPLKYGSSCTGLRCQIWLVSPNWGAKFSNLFTLFCIFTYMYVSLTLITVCIVKHDFYTGWDSGWFLLRCEGFTGWKQWVTPGSSGTELCTHDIHFFQQILLSCGGVCDTWTKLT